jgi:hypothetical protein
MLKILNIPANQRRSLPFLADQSRLVDFLQIIEAQTFLDNSINVYFYRDLATSGGSTWEDISVCIRVM